MNNDQKIFLGLTVPVAAFMGFIIATWFMILTILALLIFGLVFGGTMGRNHPYRKANRAVLIVFLVFVGLNLNVTQWPSQIARRLPGGRNALLEPDHASFPQLNQTFHEWHPWYYDGIEFDDWNTTRQEVEAVDDFIRRNITEYQYDLYPPYLMADHLPTIDQIMQADADGDGRYEDDCDGMTIFTASFLLFLGYNAFVSEVYFHWHTIVFPAGADPHTVAGYEAGIPLYASRLESFYIFNQTEMFVPPTRTVWDGIIDNLLGSYLLDFIYEMGIGPYATMEWYLFVPVLGVAALVLSIVFALLLRIFNWEVGEKGFFKPALVGAIPLAAVLFGVYGLYLAGVEQYALLATLGGLVVTLRVLERGLHPKAEDL